VTRIQQWNCLARFRQRCQISLPSLIYTERSYHSIWNLQWLYYYPRLRDLLDYLIAIEAFTARVLIYSHADFAAKVSNGLPGVAEAKSFLLGATVLNMFSWDAAGTSALDNHQQRVIGRLLMVIHSCMDVCRDPLDVSVEDDSPMTSVQHDSCESKYKALYGEQMEASQLVHVGMLGKIARGLATRNLPVIRLSSVYSQTDDRARADDSALFMDGSGALKKRQKTVKIPTPSAFIDRLSLLLFV